MNKFLIICASNDICSKNLEIADYLKEKLNCCIWKPNLKEKIPFIDKQLLNDKFFPESLFKLSQNIKKYKKLIFVLSSHNSNFTAFFKNIFDWLSVENRYFLRSKNIVLISASNSIKKDIGFEIVSTVGFKSVDCDWFKFISCIDFDNKKKQILEDLFNYINNMHA